MVEVRRNPRLAGAIAAMALVVGAGFAARGGMSVLVGVLLLLLGLAHAWLAWDARVPLAVVDDQGVRMRLGRTWRGLPWDEIDEVEHQPRPAGARGWWRDGRLTVLPVDNAAQLDGLSGVALRLGWLAERMYGVPFAVPLGLGTTVTGADEGLTDTLLALAPAEVDVVEIDPTLAETDASDGSDGSDLTDTAERPAVADPEVDAPMEPAAAEAAEPTVPEMLQDAATAGQIGPKVLELLDDAAARRRQLEQFGAVRQELRRDAGALAAQAIKKLLYA